MRVSLRFWYGGLMATIGLTMIAMKIEENSLGIFLPIGVLLGGLLITAFWAVILPNLRRANYMCVNCQQTWQMGQVTVVKECGVLAPYWDCPQCGQRHITVR